MKNIEFIATGNEIMSGLTVDTNFSWLAEKLIEFGVSIKHRCSVGDYKDDIISALQNASKRSDFAIMTGGLGPTDDDLASAAASDFFNVPLILNEECLLDIKKKLHDRNRKFLSIHKKQAIFPENSVIIKNEVGTSAGFKFSKGGVSFYFLPGVPGEFKPMIKDFVLPDILTSSNLRIRIIQNTIKTVGLGESEIAEKLKDIAFDNVELSYRIYHPEIHLKLMAKNENEEVSRKNIEKYTNLLKDKLGEYIFAFDDKNLEEVVSKLLLENSLTISTAESCTGGLLASMLTDIPGSSGYFTRGVVSYSDGSKSDLLNVANELIIKYGAVSSQVVEAMAEGIKNTSNTDVGIAISGIAGPGGGSKAKPVGTVHIGIAFKNEPVYSQRYSFSGNRRDIKLQSSKYALDIIRKKIENKSQ